MTPAIFAALMLLVAGCQAVSTFESVPTPSADTSKVPAASKRTR